MVALTPRVTIGGSTAAAACGIDPYVSRVMLWLELTGRVERPETEAMAWGKLIEPLVMAELAARGYTVGPYTPTELHDRERPWLSGHPDGSALDGSAVYLLEVKTSGRGVGWADGETPVQVRAQVQHYLHLTGLDRALVACLIQGQRLELRELERDQTAIEVMLALEEDFYGYVQRDEPPPPDGSESAREAVGLMFPDAAEGSKYRLTRAEWEAVKELRARKEQADVIAAQTRELENRLKMAMGDAEVAISPHDEEVIRWRNVTSHRLDVKTFREQRPELASLFVTETTTRRFSLA